MLSFHPLTISDRKAVQAVSLKAGRRNCNYTFANLVGWQFWFHTEVCVWKDAVVLRFNFEGKRAYMVCVEGDLQLELLSALFKDSGGNLMLIGLEDSQVQANTVQHSEYVCKTVPCRNQYDYIYLRTNLATLRGKKLSAKRNHVNRFRAEHPDFEYRPLTPEFFDECRRLTEIWQEEKEESMTIDAEHRVMETVFANWDELGMTGGSIFVDGRMVAFTYGATVTDDTFDICVEKADRHVEGAFAIVNQQFAEHLPEQYIYVNREEDMGLAGLRQSKLSYHPEILLTYNTVKINKFYVLKRMTADDAQLTVDWMVRQYGFDRHEVESWVRDLHFNWPLSVKAVDSDGNVVGLLNMSDYRIEEESSQIAVDAPDVLASLNARRYTAVFSFIVAEPYRGSRLNYDMFNSILPELKSCYDFIFIPVLHRLKTHQYWQRWGATEFYRDAECVCEDGYFHTGDTAWRDEDGYFWYVGRVDDLIKSSGYRIGPFEIESVIMELPYVLECGVCAAPDEIRGQVVKACVVLTRGKQPSDALKKEIQDYVKSRTAPYKYPRIVEFRTELPKTISGKIIRNQL